MGCHTYRDVHRARPPTSRPECGNLLLIFLFSPPAAWTEQVSSPPPRVLPHSYLDAHERFPGRRKGRKR
ncbi:hypothetical protein E2C01_071594 [Portunus trituberculatus]|uniref:Uncharacterized protein n=1 Tax=Portunus trituberculatus TaxID=210409 RepID=A0A5B7I6L8_PORTR|nr:hypothetical protein [Portunus trituberculatus]